MAISRRGLGTGASGLSIAAAWRYAPAGDGQTAEATPEVKPWIAAIHAYVPGQSTAADGRAAGQALGQREPARHQRRRRWRRARRPARPSLYPDPDSTALREALGALHGIDPARIVCGTGSGELLAARRAAPSPGRATRCSTSATASRSTRSPRAAAARRRSRRPMPTTAPTSTRCSAAVTERTRVVFLANPEQPDRQLPAARRARPAPRRPARRRAAGDRPGLRRIRRLPRTTTAALALAAGACQRARHADLLQGLRPRRRARRLGDRRARADRGAQPHPRAVQRHATARRRSAAAALGDQAFVVRSREHNRPSARASSRRSRRSAITACARCRARPTSCSCCSRAR